MISKRLKAIGDLVDTNSFCLDIGCDHAFLDIYLVRNKKNIKVIASDNKEGPLKIAKNNIAASHLNKDIKTVLADGLDSYEEGVDTLILAGMGGLNIISILKRKEEILKNIKTLIISPNNYQSAVRRYLTKKGFYIEQELLVKDGKIIYQIIKFSKGRKKYNNFDYMFGPILLQNKDNLFKEYYTRLMLEKEIILKLLPKDMIIRKIIVKKELKSIKKVLSK
jgi:tRNA (adenine22-N1)-methyltransferase